MDDHDARPEDQDPRSTALRAYVNPREAALIRAGAEEEGISVSEFLRSCATWIATEHMGLRAHTHEELVGRLVEHTSPAEA